MGRTETEKEQGQGRKKGGGQVVENRGAGRVPGKYYYGLLKNI